MELKIETRTPLWTGGVDGKVDRIHETGIIGSLRWWFEVFVRGVGGWACDPSKRKHSCKYDSGLCDVCQVFGATGWRRRFRLTIVNENSDKQNSSPTEGWQGKFSVRVQSLDKDFDPKIIGGLFQFISDWTALGAKTHKGFGEIELLNGPFDTRPLYEHLIANAGNHSYSKRLPSLQNISQHLRETPSLDDSKSDTEVFLRDLLGIEEEKE